MNFDQIILVAVIALYFTIVVYIGYYFYRRAQNHGDYVLGGRSLNPYVTALSAQASDMSGWLLMGLPGSIYLCGIGEIWIGIGLAIGSYLAWLLIAKRLRVYQEKAGDSLTLSSFFENRFHDKTGLLRDISAITILFFFTIYVASGFVSAGNVFLMIFPGTSYLVAMLIGVVVVVVYTFLGGFKAICWSDMFQALLMVIVIVAVPVMAIFSSQIGGWDNMMHILGNMTDLPDKFTNIMYSNGKAIGIIALASSLAWGLGYFGMPHVIIRYTAIRDPKELKISRRVATIWVVICLAAAGIIGVVGRAYAPDLANPETVFIFMANSLLVAALAGVVYAAILAAVMSTADSQLLQASSAVSNDLLKRFSKKEYDDKKLLWIARAVVIVIALVAAVIASSKNGSIMALVSYAWAGFGAAFGPLVILALFWKKANAKGALAGLLVGFATIVIWNTCFVSGGIIGGGTWLIFDTGLYELVPGFILSFITIIAVSLLTGGPEEQIEKEYDSYQEELEKIA